MGEKARLRAELTATREERDRALMAAQSAEDRAIAAERALDQARHQPGIRDRVRGWLEDLTRAVGF